MCNLAKFSAFPFARAQTMCQISAKILKKARHRVRDPNHSCPQATKTDEVASTSAKRPVLDQVSRDYVPISTSPKKQKVLTRHQKEVKEKKRKERDVPMMYNSLDMNSQEPFAFSQVNSMMINKSFSGVRILPNMTPIFHAQLNLSQDSRSQDAASPIKAPAVAAPASPVTPFSSRRLLFLSPSPAANKLKTSNLARSIALIPVSSPDPPSSPLNTDDEVLSQVQTLT